MQSPRTELAPLGGTAGLETYCSRGITCPRNPEAWNLLLLYLQMQSLTVSKKAYVAALASFLPARRGFVFMEKKVEVDVLLVFVSRLPR